METVSAFFKALPDTFGALELDDVFVVVFVALIVLALLLGYVLGRRVTSEEEKAKKKKAKMDKKLEREKAQETKTKKKKDSRHEKVEDKKSDVKWVDDSDLNYVPSAMPIIPEESASIFIPQSSEKAPAAPVVASKRKPAPARNTEPKEKPLEKRPPQHAKKKKGIFAKEIDESKPVESEELTTPKELVVEKPTEPEMTPVTTPATPEEMAARLAALGITDEKPVVSIGAEETETPETEVGKVELSVQPSIAVSEEEQEPKEAETALPTPVAAPFDPLEETKRLNADAAKKRVTVKKEIESSADDVQLSSRQKKKLQRDQEEAEREAEAKKEKKGSFSFFAKKKEEETVQEVEDNFEGWQEEIPDSLVGFGFTAAPAVKDEEEKK